jgi:hypothetical protein
MKGRAAIFILTFLAAWGVVYLAGCSKVDAPPPPGPQAPETQLTYAPVDLDTTTFRVHFYWNGSDKDGEVVRYHFAIDQMDTLSVDQWPSTTSKDTTLLFLVDPVAELKLHTFKIASEDNDGLTDPTPAGRSFSAKTVPPTSEIVKGPAAFNPIVGPNFTFEWIGNDPDGGETGGKAPVDSFEYLLLLILPDPGPNQLPTFDQTKYVGFINDAVGEGLLDYGPDPNNNGQGRDYSNWKWVGIRSIRNVTNDLRPSLLDDLGLLPALRVGRQGGTAFGEGLALHAGEGRTTGDRQGERLRTLLVAAQIAMTLVLLIGAGLLIHSFVRLTSVSPGFESSGSDGVVQTVKVTLPPHLYDEPARIHAFARGVLDRIQYVPGVTSASLINSAPFGMMFIRGDFGIEGQPKPKLSAGRPKIAAGYFKTMGIPLLAGREFTARDTADAPNVAIVSERIVREYFPGDPGEALGRRVRVGDRGEWLTVVGVVADIRQMGLDRDVQPMLYVPFQQERGEVFVLRFVSFVARTATPASVVEGIRSEIRRAAPDLPIQSTVTMDQAVAASVAPPRFRMWLLALFAMTATLIATCGIYGLMAYAVTQRRREIGVRMALGAQRRDVLRLVLARALRIVVAGLIVGLAGAAGVTRVLQTFLFGVTPTDPIAFTIVTLLLMAVGLMAAWLPARRATRIDPCAALRAE